MALQNQVDIGASYPDASNRLYSPEKDAGRSNFLAFIIGGLMIAAGLLAFLVYDQGVGGRNMSPPRNSEQLAPTISEPAPSLNAPAQVNRP